MSPKITICIPTSNRSDLLNQALQSVAMQTIKPFEVLIVDNASTDNTQDIVKKYDIYGFRYIRNSTNVGMVENWNVGIRNANGDYISFLHNDDLIAPTWYEEWLHIIQNNNARFYTGSIAIIDQYNKPLYSCHTFTKSKLIPKDHVFHEFWTHLSPAIAPTAASIYDLTLFKDTGMFDASKGTEADVIKFLEVFSITDVYYLDKLLFTYRSHPGQGFDKVAQTKSLERELSRLDNYFSILAGFYERQFKSDDNHRFFIQYPLSMTFAPAVLYLAKGDVNKVKGYYHTLVKHFPSFFNRAGDWSVFLRVFTFFIGRALFGKFISSNDRKQLDWIKNITSSSDSSHSL